MARWHKVIICNDCKSVFKKDDEICLCKHCGNELGEIKRKQGWGERFWHYQCNEQNVAHGVGKRTLFGWILRPKEAAEAALKEEV